MNILILVGIYLFFVIGRKAKAAAALEYSFGLPYSVSITNGMLRFVQPMEVVNKESTQLNIGGSSINFTTLKGVSLGTTTLMGRYTIPPLSATTLHIEIVSSLSNLLRAGPEIIALIKTGSLNVNFSGTLNAEGFTIPVSKQIYSYQFPKILNLTQ